MNTLASNEAELAALREKCRLYESWLRAIDKHARFDVWFKDAESRYLYVNESFEHAMGMGRERLLGATPGDIFSDPEREGRVVAMDQKVMEQGELHRVIPCDGSGSLQMHEEYRFPVEDSEGKVSGLGCFAIEVSEQSFAEEALNQAQQIAKLGSWRWSIKDQCLISCSDQFAELLGCSVTEAFTLMQHRLDRVVHPEDRHILEGIHNRSARDEHTEYRIEYRIIQRTGEVRYVVEIAQPLYGNAGEPVEYAGTLQDITAQKQVEDELREAKERLEHRVAQRTKHLKYLASHDSLTGLLNRSGYYDYLQDQLSDAPEPQEIAVVVLDLDGFKLVNDTYGHAAGDKVLKVVARRLQKSLKRDDLIVRLGGDEFVLFLKDLDSPLENARSICNRLRKVVGAPIAVGNLEVRVGCSAGISFINSGEVGKDQFEKAIANADIALYRTKGTSGVYCTVFEAKMGSEVVRQQRLENDLRAAIDEGAISVDYQPQVCLHSKRVLAIEALCRWIHKDLGSIPPNVFIPIAEHCGLINQLSQIVLEQACAAMRALQCRRGCSDIRLAVNFSVAQFYDEDLLSSIARVLQTHGLPASKLEVEVTESLFIRNPEHTKTILDDMRTMGLRVALDDFGTGYSALSYLKEFEVDTIKLDRSFISSIGSRDIDLRIVEGIVRLAKSLGLTVVSEGIETLDQDRFLRSIGCDVAQGYLYGKPISLERLTQSIETLNSSGMLRPISAVV